MAWAALAAGVLLQSGEAAAATFEVDRTVDLATASHNSSGVNFNPSLFGPLDLNVSQGDTLIFRVDFLAGQSVGETSLSAANASAFFTPSRAVFGVSGLDMLTFFTAGGPVTVGPAGVVGDFSDISILGEVQAAALLGAPKTFTGFSFTLPVSLDGATSVHLTNEAFGFSGNGFTVNQAPPASGAPEPATWGLMLAGFGLAGAALRRRRSVPA